LFAAIESGYSGLRKEQGRALPEKGYELAGLSGPDFAIFSFLAFAIVCFIRYPENFSACKRLKSNHIEKLFRI
jgi:hypothetical protein